MLYQEISWIEIISLSEIIGACIATFFAIMTWWLIEKLAKWAEWRAVVKSFNELFEIFMAKKYEPNTSIDVVNIILEDIGEKIFKKILRLNYTLNQGIYNFEGNDFKIEAMCGIAGNHLKLYQYSMPIYDFRKPEEGVET